MLSASKLATSNLLVSHYLVKVKLEVKVKVKENRPIEIESDSKRDTI